MRNVIDGFKSFLRGTRNFIKIQVAKEKASLDSHYKELAKRERAAGRAPSSSDDPVVTAVIFIFLLLLSTPAAIIWGTIDRHVGITQDGKAYKVEQEVKEEMYRDSVKAYIMFQRDSLNAERAYDNANNQSDQGPLPSR